MHRACTVQRIWALLLATLLAQKHSVVVRCVVTGCILPPTTYLCTLFLSLGVIFVVLVHMCSTIA